MKRRAVHEARREGRESCPNLEQCQQTIMVQRYAHLFPDQVRAAEERLTRNEIGTQAFSGGPGGGVTAKEQMVTRLGVEPRTPGLKGRYSAS